MATISDLNTALDQTQASVAALAAAAGQVGSVDLQPAIDTVNGLKSTIDGITAELGGTPPA